MSPYQHTEFVVTWTLATSAEVAARVLGSTIENVKRVADWMRNEGVPLKVFNDVQGGRGEADPGSSVAQTNDAEVPATEVGNASSYIAQLKTAAQLEFYRKYVVGKGSRTGIATAVAEHHALKSGDIGRAGIASGAVEDAAFEAVAQLVVAPPKGFDVTHRKVEGYVVRHVRNAVQNRLNKEFGTNAKRFGGYAADHLIEVAGREQDPAEHGDADADIARAKAREAEDARRLEQVKGVVPGGAIPTDRAGRMALLRALGQGKTEAVTNAAESRFYMVLAGIIPSLLEATPRERPAVQPATPKLPGPSVHVVPHSVRQRFVPTTPVKSRQREAERFVVAWERSSCALEAAQKLGKSVKTVAAYAAYLREVGVKNLKVMPARPGPLVRGVRALVPSRN